MPSIIHWFRRDLRLNDNPALHAALHASGGHIIPLFIFDDAILRAPETSAARVIFLLDSLQALDQSLRARGSRLLLRRGEPRTVLPALAQQSGACALYFNHDYTPFARARDQAVEQALRDSGLGVHTFHEAVIVEPGALLNKAGSPYVVYTPYSRQWRARVEAQPIAPPPALPPIRPVPEKLDSYMLPSAADLGFATEQEILPGGEAAAQQRLGAFVDYQNELGIAGYHHGRERPALAATSRLSAYLRFGCIAPAACLRAAQQLAARLGPHAAQTSIDTWVGELAWRDFYYQVLANFPHVADGAFRRQYDAIRWDGDEAHFAAWSEGRTGYPIVDAAMRQLAREAWMHNRARMIVASFLTKDLLIDWRRGERFFMRMLIDGDQASNNGGWQWAAGTGTDPQPYFRIFNPVSQGQKFDPRGDYVRRYVPELEHVPARYIHAPWTMPPAEQRAAGVQIGRDYPAPIVDHAAQRDRALAMYRRARSAAE